MNRLFVVLVSWFLVVGVECRVPDCEAIELMKSEIQKFVDGTISYIPTAVRFGQTSIY